MNFENNIIAVKGLTKKYGNFTAVDSISFTVQEGEIFGFLGPNGAGKTTTINVLCTLLAPTNGTAAVAGYDTVHERNRVRQSIGLVFQEPAIDLKLTARENLYLHARLYGVERSVFEQRFQEVMKLVELWDRRNDKVEVYSGGMKRRMEIARGLLHYPKVLFLDEPTLGLDPQTRNHLWTYILKLKREKQMTIFMTTHYMHEAEYCDRVAIIDHGRIVKMGTPAELKREIGGDVISMRLGGNLTESMATLREKLQLHPEQENDVVRINVQNSERVLPEILKTLSVPVESLEVHRPTLDDVFLKVTGHELRDVQESSEKVKQSFRGFRRGM